MKRTKTPASEPIGYIVRYDNIEITSPNPLFYPDPVLWINSEWGTIFPTRKAANAAVRKSIRFQAKRGLRWNEMYGPYIVSPVYL